MSKKEKPEIIASDFVDGTRFGYDDDVLVQIPGQLFYALMRMVGQLANDEVTWKYQINSNSLAETASPDNVVNVISNEGITYFNFLGELESLHMQNIKAGKTLPIEEVQEKLQKKIEEKLKEVSANGTEELEPPKVNEVTPTKKRLKKTN